MSRNYDSVMRIALSCKEPLWSDALVALLSANQSCEVVAVELDTRSLITAAKDQYAQALVIDSTKLDQSDLQFLLGARAFGDFEIILIIQEDEMEMYQGIPVDRIVTRAQSAKSLYDALGAVSTAQAAPTTRSRGPQAVRLERGQRSQPSRVRSRFAGRQGNEQPTNFGSNRPARAEREEPGERGYAKAALRKPRSGRP